MVCPTTCRSKKTQSRVKTMSLWCSEHPDPSFKARRQGLAEESVLAVKGRKTAHSNEELTTYKKQQSDAKRLWGSQSNWIPKSELEKSAGSVNKASRSTQKMHRDSNHWSSSLGQHWPHPSCHDTSPQIQENGSLFLSGLECPSSIYKCQTKNQIKVMNHHY